MPIYCYKCDACGSTKEVCRSMDDSQLPELCDVDAFVMIRDLHAEHGGTKHKPGNWPMVSNAAGVAPKQAKEATEHATSIGVPTHFNSDGDAEFKSAKHRQKYCRAIGLHDRNGGYSDP